MKKTLLLCTVFCFLFVNMGFAACRIPPNLKVGSGQRILFNNEKAIKGIIKEIDNKGCWVVMEVFGSSGDLTVNFEYVVALSPIATPEEEAALELENRRLENKIAAAMEASKAKQSKIGNTEQREAQPKQE